MRVLLSYHPRDARSGEWRTDQRPRIDTRVDWQLNPWPGESRMHRREFLERSSAVLAGAAMLNWTGEMQGQTAARTIGIQVGAVSFLDEGTDRVLDLFVENGINTLFLAIF